MIEPHYKVDQRNNLIVADISGDWDIQADIGYLTLLDEKMSIVRHTPWALVADLRGWRVSKEIINLKHNHTIQLLRGHQVIECWLVDDMQQGQHIQHHVENAGIPFYKCLHMTEVENYLKQYGFHL